jgi:hypothetical protein
VRDDDGAGGVERPGARVNRAFRQALSGGASCIAGMAPLDFGNPPADFLAAVGIQDLWENP